MMRISLFIFLILFIPSCYGAEAAPESLSALVEKANREQGKQPEAIPLQNKTAIPPEAATMPVAPVPTQIVPHGIPLREDPFEVEVPKPKPPTLRDQAFKELLDKISPLSPEQIVEMRKAQDRTQRAVATLPDSPARPVSSTLTIDLSPGVTPPVIRLGAGFVSSLVFVDATGQSWPISDYSLGNPKSFNIQWDKKTNTLFIQSTTTYSNGNLAIRLATLNTPIMLSLVSGQREVDYRVDLRVQGRGPNAAAPIAGDSLPSAPNPLLISVLDGVPPPGSLELIVSGGCGRAWIHKGKLIFRTHLTVISPAWTATMSSIDGTRVYEMGPTPMILASENGKTVKILIGGL